MSCGLAVSYFEDHRRVRCASKVTGRYRVEPVLPVDVMGAYVFVPYRGAVGFRRLL